MATTAAFPGDIGTIAGLWWPYLQFWFGYLLIALVPGPNVVLVAALAAQRGLRGAGGLILSMASGGGALAALLFLAVQASLPPLQLQRAFDLMKPALLVFIAWQVLRAGSPSSAGRSAAPHALGSPRFCGLVTALTNPVTATYFLSHYTINSRAFTLDGSAIILACGVMVIAALRLALIALLLAQPAMRDRFPRCRRLICRGVGITFIGLAISAVTSLVQAAAL